MDLGHGGAAIGLALPAEPLLMRAEIGDPRLDLGPELLPQVGPRWWGRFWPFGNGAAHGQQGRDVVQRRRSAGSAGSLEGEQADRRRDGVFSASGFLPDTD